MVVHRGLMVPEMPVRTQLFDQFSSSVVNVNFILTGNADDNVSVAQNANADRTLQSRNLPGNEKRYEYWMLKSGNI